MQDGEFLQAQLVLKPLLGVSPADKTVLHLSGISSFELGEFNEAQDFFARLIDVAPDSAVAFNNLGLAQQELERWTEALASHRKAVTLAPNLAEAHYNLGLVLQQTQELNLARNAYANALTIDPEHTGALLNLGAVNHMLGDVTRAIEIYTRAIGYWPNHAQLRVNLGKAFIEIGDLEQAKSQLKTALDCDSENAESACHLGRVYRRLENFPKALHWGHRAVQLDRQSAECHKFLGLALKETGDLSQALGHFEQGLSILRNPDRTHSQLFTFTQTTRSKLDHDIEQNQFLLARNRPVDSTALQGLIRLRRELGSGPGGKIESISPKAHHNIAGVYNRLCYRRASKGFGGSALNSHLDASKIQDNYRQRAPGIVYFDGLLSPRALDELYQFCLESTIWFDFHHSNGYLGAYMEEGFHSPLLLGIAQELTSLLPSIFSNHRLLQLWAYKYDSDLSGIEMHADFAAINVNFWITPDSANRNSDTGGMVIWDKEAPGDWPFQRYNSNAPDDQRAIRDFLRDSGAKSLKIPYRQNRVVIFNSDLFHQTDDIEFYRGYENRRINVTMLFGKRDHRIVQ